MSAETRQKLISDPRLVLSKESQKSDILNTAKTNTWLIEFMLQLLKGPRPILVTCLNSDHKPGTYHNPAGRGLDFWHADWAAVGDDKVLEVMQQVAKVGFTYAPALLEVGLSGHAAKYKTYVTWPTSNVFVESYEYNNEHLHVAVGVPK